MNNKKIGNLMEKKVAETLALGGYWVHRLQDNHNGQPFDMIAIRENRAYCIECKHCAGSVFLFSRLEFNQRNAFYKLEKCKTYGYIAIQFSGADKFYLVDYNYVRELEKEHKCCFAEEELILNGYKCFKFNNN